MNLRSLILAILLFLLAGGLYTVSSEQIPEDTLNISSARDLVSFVEDAVLYARKVGKDTALEIFHDPDGQFTRGEAYIWAYDFEGINLAHPIHPEFRGQNKLLLTDPDGFPMIEAMRNTALNGSGFVTYRYENPVTGEIESKLSYVKRVDDTWWIASGIYGENITIPDTIPDKVRETLTRRVSEAVEYAAVAGKEKALSTFNDPYGSFTRNGSYIFAFDLKGTTLAMPFHPEKIGVNESDLTDWNGVSVGREKLRIARAGGGFWYYVFDNPDAGFRPDFKVSYIRSVGDDWVIGTGMYLPDVKADFPAGDRDALVARVKEAVMYVKEHGSDAAIREFNDPNGSFSDSMMYIFAFDSNGTLLANPYLPGLVGASRIHDQDMYGANPPGQMIANAENGGGFAYFFFADPADEFAIKLKLAYTEPADDLVVGSGIFVEE